MSAASYFHVVVSGVEKFKFVTFPPVELSDFSLFPLEFASVNKKSGKCYQTAKDLLV